VEGITDRTCCSRQLIQLIYFAKLEGVDKSTSSKRKKKTKENKRKQKKTKENKRKKSLYYWEKETTVASKQWKHQRR
jgi:hypothetical protein